MWNAVCQKYQDVLLHLVVSCSMQTSRLFWIKAYYHDVVTLVCPSCMHTECNSMYFETAVAVCIISKKHKYMIQNAALVQLVAMHTDSHSNTSPCFLPGLRGCPRGGGDDPRRSLCVFGALWLWHSEHHPAHPEPHPSNAPPPPHPSTWGDLFPPSQDGRLLPHLLQAECAHNVQGHVPRRVQQLQPEKAGGAGGGGGTGCRLDAQGQRCCINVPRTFSEWAAK